MPWTSSTPAAASRTIRNRKRGNGNFWDNDAVEIYIETLNKRSSERGEQSAHQFFAFPFGTQTDEGVGGYESKILRNKVRNMEWTIAPVPNGKEAMLRETPVRI